jgi:hypothetical protein
LPGQRVPVDRLVWAVGARAEGLGSRAVARVLEVAPKTGLAWLGEVAEHAAAFSRDCLHDVRVTQGQRDALLARRSAVKTGEVNEAEASTRLSRSPHGVWAASAPVTKRLLTIEVGARTRAMAQRVVVYLQRAGKYKRPPWRPSQGQKGLAERAIMASQPASHSW